MSSTTRVRYRGNDNLVSAAHGFQAVLLKGFVDAVVALYNVAPIACHARCYGHGEFVCDPLFYLALLETKPGVLGLSAALQGWILLPAFQQVRHLRMGNREFIQVLCLLEIAARKVVAAAVADANHLRTIGSDAVRQIALVRIDRSRAKLDLTAFPFLPSAQERMIRAADHATLLQVQVA